MRWRKADLRAGETLPGAGRKLVRTYALSPDLLAMSQVWATDGHGLADRGQGRARGDGRSVPARCRRPCGADSAGRSDGEGRVCACWGWPRPRLPVPICPTASAISPFAFWVWSALPIRCAPRCRDAVALCRSAGIRVIMITGDYPATAQAIAAQAGLQGGRVIDGTELQAMSDPDLATAVQDVTIFARIMPEQKLRIVNALKATGAVVAMTGDGVNDAPSLKAADIGVAMGGRGTDVAREAASIVLLDDDFGSIVTTVRLGRRIYDNLRKAMSFILAVHVPIAGLALMPLLFGMPILFGPMHIAFLEMVIDPVCSLVFEAETEEEGVMKRPPRPPAEPLFSGPTILWSLVQGRAGSGRDRHDLCARARLWAGRPIRCAG